MKTNDASPVSKLLDGSVLVNAVSDAKPGESLGAAPGRYQLTSTLLITKPLQLVWPGVIIVAAPAAAAIEVSAAGMVRIEGLGIEANAAGGIVHTGAELSLVQCSLSGPGMAEDSGSGIVGSGMGTLTVESCRVTKFKEGILAKDDSVLTSVTNSVSSCVAAIALSDRASGTVDGNRCFQNMVGLYAGDDSRPTFIRNQCQDSKMSAILLRERSVTTAIHNQCDKSGGHGIYITESARATLIGNAIQRSSYIGIAFDGAATGVASENILISNTQSGLSAGGDSNVRVVDNICAHNGFSGVAAFASAEVQVQRNACFENVQHGVFVNGKARARVERNQLYRNGMCGISSFGESEGTLTKNRCFANMFQGIYVGGSARPIVTENLCRMNDENGLLIDETAKPEVGENVFEANVLSGVVWKSAATKV